MSVGYASYCCAKDRERGAQNYVQHMESHQHAFDEVFQVFQRCESFPLDPRFTPILISDEDYPAILGAFGIQYPDAIAEKWTHGWGAAHYAHHHQVNHLRALQVATSEYMVFADGDCFLKNQPAGHSWIETGIKLLESRSELFVISPNEGGPERLETIMSQQMFLVNRKRFMEMDFIPWDGVFPEGGPMAEYHFMLEGHIARHMAKHGLFRFVLPAEFRYWHKEWH